VSQPEDIDDDEVTAATPVDGRAELSRIVEALLLSADQALPIEHMQALIDPNNEFGLTRPELRLALAVLRERLDNGSALELVEVASGWRVQVRARYAAQIGRLWHEKPPRYSRALLETLALIVYRQPVTRGEIEEVRGVAVSPNIMRTLSERGWIREVGVKEVPGRPSLFGTTSQFLDDLGLRSLDDLPSLPEVRDLDQLEAALERMSAARDPASAQGDPSREIPGTSADA